MVAWGKYLLNVILSVESIIFPLTGTGRYTSELIR